MAISENLSKFALGVNSQGILSAAKGGTGSTSGGGSNSPTITVVGYPGNDTAVNTSGGDTVTLTGTNFNVGITVVINGTPASVVTRVSATQLTFTTPAQATGSYIIYVVNTDGSTALAVPGLQYSPLPTWTTAAGSLGSPNTSVSFTTTLVSVGDAPITYSLYSGTLPSGITINSSTGVLSGTTANLGSSTTYNFTIRATDAQLQDTDRAFSITVAPVVYAIDYLIVAGGGGVGTYGGGGAGAGGYLTTIGGSQFIATSGVLYTIAVGAAGGTNNATERGANGGNSTAFGLTAYGGGGGGYSGTSGGSGGGGNINYGAGGQGISGQGYAAAQTSYWQGGGGAGGAATNYSAGPGASNDITGTSYTYSVGGEGYNGSSSSSSDPTYGNAGTGTYGKGGSGTVTAPGSSGNGIVVVRYSNTLPVPSAITGNPAYTVSGGYRRYVFTSSGSITF